MTYSLSKRSLRNLDGVHPSLVSLVKEVIKVTPVDFGILESGGLRTKEMQRQLVKRGVSKTMNSKHLPQSDGFGHAVDLVPYVSGAGFRWEWDLIYPIAATMAENAQNAGLRLRWGGVWDRSLENLLDSAGGALSNADVIRVEVREYTHRHPGPDFIDGPHYQILEVLDQQAAA